MYLKKLEMKGFKSFADKTEIIYENGVTCVVGPNGSGKSNITDAVRWVLGEQKVKTLRGNSMADVIFNGTKHRKQLGMAEVTLTFDNQEQFFPLDYNEVSVTRRVYRSGDSEYLLNGASCRLKDVKELFMDTGIGTDGYSIIGQGRIDRVLSNKAEERRQIFEEAAGIVKYKSRKREAERKLASTNSNLLRVEDILQELDGRIEPLRIESEKALAFKEHSEHLRSLEVHLFVRDIELIDAKRAKAQQAEQEIQTSRDQVHGRIRDLTRTIGGKEETLKAKEFAVKEIERDLIEKTEAKGHVEAQMEAALEKHRNMESNMLRLSQELEDLKSSKIMKETERDRLDQEREVLRNALTDVEIALEGKRQAYDQLMLTLAEQESNTESMRSRIIELLNAGEREKIEIQSRESMIERLKAQTEQILVQKTESENRLVTCQVELQALESKRASLQANYDQVKADLTKAYGKQEEDQKEAKVLEERLDQLRQQLTKQRHEKKLLEEMEKSFEGYDYSVRGILKACSQNPSLNQGVHGVVASLVSIPERFITAVEVSLGRQLQNIVTENEQDAKRLIDHLKKNRMGRVTFLPLSNLKTYDNRLSPAISNMEGVIGRGCEILSYAPKYATLMEYMLGRTVFVENYSIAVKLLKTKGFKHRIVTLDGEILQPGGAISGGSFKSKVSNLLGRKKRIDDLTKDITETETTGRQTMDQYQGVKERLNSFALRVDQLKEDSDGLRMQLVRLEGDQETIQHSLQRAEVEKNRYVREYTMMAQEEQQALDQISDKRRRLIEIDAEKEAIQKDMTSQSSDIASKQDQAKTMMDDITGIRIGFAAQKEKLEHASSDVNRVIGEIRTIAGHMGRKEAEKQALVSEKDETSEGIVVLEARLEKEAQNLSLMDEKRKEVEGAIAAIQTVLVDERLQLETAHGESEALRDKAHKHEVMVAKLEVERDGHIQSLWEKYEIGMMEAKEMRLEVEEGEAKKEVVSLRKKLRAIGEVNMHAIEEYAEVKERHGFLTEQKDDLVKSRKILDKVIRDLEKQMKSQFKEKFDQVKVHFKDIFQQLFHGGQSDLILVDPENLLESDIEIVAQPPGKKLQSLNLLSGGERAMTAIALMFAIFRTKPAPFCILDEIEAALDDVNVFRFAEFLKDFTRSSQFVIITHRKGTMEIADTLFGVTMQEYGVSKVVSVQLEDIAPEAV